MAEAMCAVIARTYRSTGSRPRYEITVSGRQSFRQCFCGRRCMDSDTVRSNWRSTGELRPEGKPSYSEVQQPRKIQPEKQSHQNTQNFAHKDNPGGWVGQCHSSLALSRHISYRYSISCTATAAVQPRMILRVAAGPRAPKEPASHIIDAVAGVSTPRRWSCTWLA